MLEISSLHNARSYDVRISRSPQQGHSKNDETVRFYEQELWTAKQRQAASIHEVSYRACFKPQLPAYFISRLTQAGDVVYDPFSGRGTTAIEAALHGRNVIANDVNPLSAMLAQPRLAVPALQEIEARLQSLPSQNAGFAEEHNLDMFFHRDTLVEIVALRDHLQQRQNAGLEDDLDRWIRMVATNRLTGHSVGFFSVYTLPPNQATTRDNQIRINKQRKQTPAYRDTRVIILKKSKQLLRNLSAPDVERLRHAARNAMFLTGGADATPQIADNSVQLTVTSPPFLDVVQYANDNWLRCWFNGLDAGTIGKHITMSRTIEQWNDAMARVFDELYRITRPGGWVAFEVGEVRKGKIKLEEHVVPLGLNAGFDCEAVLINSQTFTKTANIWGVGNNRAGTNSNRIVVLRKSN